MTPEEVEKRIKAISKAGLSENYSQGVYHVTQYDGNAKLKTLSGKYDGDAQSVMVKGSVVTSTVTLVIKKLAASEDHETRQRKPAVELEMTVDVARAMFTALQHVLGKLEAAEKVVGR